MRLMYTNWTQTLGGWRRLVAFAAAAVTLAGISTWAVIQSGTSDGRHTADEVAHASTPPLDSGDFTRFLAPRINEQLVLREIQRLCDEGSVTMAAADVTGKPLRDGELRRVDFGLKLAGRYLGVRKVLRDLRDSHPGMTFTQLSMSPSVTPGHIDAVLAIAVWSTSR